MTNRSRRPRRRTAARRRGSPRCAWTRRTAQPTSATGARLSGRTITFEPNTLGIRNAVLEVGDGARPADRRPRARRSVIVVGRARDEPARRRRHRTSCGPAADPEDVLVSGAWTAPDTYVLTFRFVESPVRPHGDRDGRRATTWSGWQRRWQRGLRPAGTSRRSRGTPRLSRSASSRTVHQSLRSRLRKPVTSCWPAVRRGSDPWCECRNVLRRDVHEADAGAGGPRAGASTTSTRQSRAASAVSEALTCCWCEIGDGTPDAAVQPAPGRTRAAAGRPNRRAGRCPPASRRSRRAASGRCRRTPRSR